METYKITFTDEQMETIKKCMDIIIKACESVKEIIIEAFNQLKGFLNKEVSIRTKKHKKGKKYIHNYIKIKLWKVIVGDLE